MAAAENNARSLRSSSRFRDRNERVGQHELTLRMADRQHRTGRDADDPLGAAAPEV